MDIHSGWLEGASVRIRESAHCDERPDPSDISMVTVHNISLPIGKFGGPHAENLFTGNLDCSQHDSFASLHGLRVSAHVLIRRGGEIIQFVPFHKRAWHAGVSCYRDRDNCNDYAIGIELEGTDTWVYTYAQYIGLVNVVSLLCTVYPGVSPDCIVGHSEIAPGRKTDPGVAFDWTYFTEKLRLANIVL